MRPAGQRVAMAALTLATVEGAATGAGGVLTTLIDIPLLFVLSLRTILRIGHCYGYSLDHPHDQRFVLGVLIAATSGSLATRRKRLDQLREIEHLLVEETQEEILADEALSILFQLEIFEEVPGVGLVSGARLEPGLHAPGRYHGATRFSGALARGQRQGPRRSSRLPFTHDTCVHGWRGAFERVAYSGFTWSAFGVALPV